MFVVRDAVADAGDGDCPERRFNVAVVSDDCHPVADWAVDQTVRGGEDQAFGNKDAGTDLTDTALAGEALPETQIGAHRVPQCHHAIADDN